MDKNQCCREKEKRIFKELKKDYYDMLDSLLYFDSMPKEYIDKLKDFKQKIRRGCK